MDIDGKDELGIAADMAVDRALSAVPLIVGEHYDSWLYRVREHAKAQLAKNASAGISWGTYMVHGDKESIDCVKMMLSAPVNPFCKDCRERGNINT